MSIKTTRSYLVRCWLSKVWLAQHSQKKCEKQSRQGVRITYFTHCRTSGSLLGFSASSESDTSRMIATIDKTPVAQPSTFTSSNTLSKALQLHKTTRTIKPTYHPQWKLMRVISGHLGWVRSVAVEPGNKWFASGAGDRVIKIWDLASGELKLSLTGHISTVRGLAVSSRHPYLFSCGEDKVR